MTRPATNASHWKPFDASGERLRRIAGWLTLWAIIGGLTALALDLRMDAPVRITAPVNDLAGAIGPADARAIEDTLRRHREATGVQVAVLTVRTTHGVPIEDFSHAVAEAWGGGRAGHDDGLLFTLAIDDRRMRIEVGRGLEDRVSDAAAAAILGEIGPLLRAERYGQAAARVVDRLVEATGGSATLEERVSASAGAPLARGPSPGVGAALAIAYGQGATVARIVLAAGLLGWLGWIFLWVITAAPRFEPRVMARFYADHPVWPVVSFCLVAASTLFGGVILGFWHGASGAVVTVPIIAGILLLVLGIPLLLWTLGASLRAWRARPRACAQGDGMMRRVDPEGPDGGLSSGQLTEIAIRSRVYDIWLCPNGHREAPGFPGANPADLCGRCSHLTLRRGRWVTVSAATYTSTGLAERDAHCVHCGHRTTETRVIPMRVETSSSSSGSSSSWSSGGSSGGWSGGGGSFGGGGASGSW